ncbi:jg15343 [Pararge aegeria aegeria]|uniref:Jg15343 protein n=1 Tax=Pararge aegeria aegeria TaxID=348720 RepID=A0A8S4RGZ6_9NEOP|nr:jg15343 [Pararge aegeria aegeria]
MLQKIHQKIMTKCEEANMKLDAMVDALDNASIDLQNVNNKFMALSNNQFVESRVYDDDVDVSTEVNISKSEPPVVEAESEITKLKRSLARLEQMHEPIHILDSDSSDDEDDGRIIMKPKKVYAHRPLPYIIGTQEWKNKWHAGLVQEESDSDSSLSKHDNIPAEEYSESEPETVQTDKLERRTISSSSMESEMTSQPPASSQIVKQPAKPADIAAELARRLGGPVQLPASEPVDIHAPPEQTSEKVYRVEKPAPTTIFSDEPPPLDDYQSYKSDYTDDDDIFAELHRKPNPDINKDQNRVANDLFGGLSDNIVDDLFGEETRDNDIGNVVDYQDVKPSASGSPKTPVFEEGVQSKTVAENPKPKPRQIETKAETEGAVKKPVGGISLFGTIKGAENIGAAILKRNQGKSSSSEGDTRNAMENKLKVPNASISKEEPVNKIIEDLFSKPTKKKTIKEEIISKKEPEKITSKDKVDLFSDNLFDDIDDIFTTNIVKKPKDNKPQKSIFDDDDLFADITLKKPDKHNDKSERKSIFDNNDDLFGENNNSLKTEVIISSNPINVDKHDMIAEESVKVNIESDKKAKGTESKGLFDDDSDDDLFSGVKMAGELHNPQKSTIENIKHVNFTRKNYSNETLSTETINNEENKEVSTSHLNPVRSNSHVESPSLFDDNEFDDLFSAQTKPSKLSEKTLDKNNHVIENKEKSKTIDNDETARPRKLENEVLESLHTIEKDNVVAAKVRNSSITNEIGKSETSQPEEDVINDTLDKTHTRTSYFTDLDDISKENAHSKHLETLHKDGTNIPPSDISPEVLTSEPVGPDILSDIFIDTPPAFEKPLEPKKSKNVNALFDDDSDDEALFFKKNEAISDEKPELNCSSDRFRIFHDEPPEIDATFSQTPSKITPSLVSELPGSELFGSSHKSQEPEKIDVSNSVKDFNEYHIDLSKENKAPNVVDNTKIIENSVDSDKNQEINVPRLLESFQANTKKDLTEVAKEQTERSEEMLGNRDFNEEPEPKKPIGKLKHMNFNINVNTLLPGASLKKSITNEETDGVRISTKSNEELHIHSPEKNETKMVKSVSFDGDPESEVLDNKYSKQRAKIQVKRRPSSRRARLEAVRKSRIDLASDSTDNSSSLDEPPYKEIGNRESLVDNVDSTYTLFKSTSSDTLTINNTITVDITNPTNTSSLPEMSHTATDILIDTNNSQADVKSKVVYILNDEDIFNDKNPRTGENIESYKAHDTMNVLDIVDDDDEFLFKSPNISTLGKSYENTATSSSNYKQADPKTSVLVESDNKHSGIAKEKLSKTKKSIFDDLSDDENELFRSKIPTVQKSNTFDSDSEGESLFVKSKINSKSNNEVKRETMRGSLFGDESDDDSDLFGVKVGKTSGNVRQNAPPKPKEVQPKTSEPVFEDPLSMFGDDS